MGRMPEVVLIRDRSFHRAPLIDLTQPDTPHEGAMNSTPFNPRSNVRTEGTKRPSQTDEPDNAIAAAMKRAQEKKDREREEARGAREQRKQDRVAQVQATQAAAEDRALQEAADEAAREARRKEIQDRLATLRATMTKPRPPAQSAQVQDIEEAIMQTASGIDPQPEYNTPPAKPKASKPARTVEQPQPQDTRPLPDYVPRVQRPAPGDPRVLNGTMAPSPRVAERIAAMQQNETVTKEREPGPSSLVDVWGDILETGNLVQIMAGRDPDQLTGRDRDAYDRVLATGTHDQIQAGRKLTDLSPRELTAFHKAIGRKSVEARTERWGTPDPNEIRRIKIERGLVEAPPPAPRRSPPPKLRVADEAPQWVHRLIKAMKRNNMNGFALSAAIGRERWWLRDVLRARKTPDARPLPAPAREKIAAVLGMRPGSLLPKKGEEGADTVGQREVEALNTIPAEGPENNTILDEAMGDDSRTTAPWPPRGKPDAAETVTVEFGGVQYMPSFTIENDVPLPPPPGVTVWGFALMKVGQSFGVPIDASGTAAVLAKVERAVAKFTKTSPWTFQVAERPGEVRCWRIT